MLVSNASTLILLAKVSIIRKFLNEFGEVAIPEEVEKEIAEGDMFDSKLLKKEIEDNRIIVKAIKSGTSNITKEFRIHKGEAETYILYNECNAKAILTDDGELIKLCKLFEIPFINALAIITRMFEKSIITHAEACEYLQKLNDYGRYSKEIYNYFKQEVNCP
jgi:predicted nucleic acid-binding protein